jgi:hypothetical protein
MKIEEHTDKFTNLTKRYVSNRVIASDIKIGDVIQSPFMSAYKMEVTKITETEKSLIFTGNYVLVPIGGTLGKQWAYTFRKTTKVKVILFV